jgi:hypothetical protein
MISRKILAINSPALGNMNFFLHQIKLQNFILSSMCRANKDFLKNTFYSFMVLTLFPSLEIFTFEHKIISIMKATGK